MEKTIKIDHEVMRILDLKEVRRIICDTDKGTLKLLIRKGESEYHLELDAVPLLPSVNKELMTLLFPIPKMEAPKQVNKEMLKELGSDKKEPMSLREVSHPILEEDNKNGIISSPYGGTPTATYKGLNGKGEISKKEINERFNALTPKKKLGRPKGVKSGIKME